MEHPSQIEDQEIRLLNETLPYIITKGRADSTTTKYNQGWRGWVRWAEQKSEVKIRPAHPFYVAIYLNHLLFVNRKKGSITAAFYGIRWTVGLASPTDNPLVQLAYEGCTRSCRGTKQKKDAMLTDTVKNLVDLFAGKPFNLMNQRFLMVCLLGFSGFFRIKELLKVQLKNLTFTKDHLTIFLEQSKVDQHRHGENVYIARTGTKYCPVSFTENFLKDAGFHIIQNEESFIIPRLFKTKKGHTACKTKGISYTTIRENFAENIRVIEQRRNYGLHSLRSGGASAAAQNGVSDRLISKQGRWSSTSTKARDGYIEDNMQSRLSVTRALSL